VRTDLSPPLPLSVQDWPILPNANLTVLTKRLYLIRPREAWCGDRRHGWFCTRERDHLLPHVACGRLEVAGVWDQQWFGDRNLTRPIPVSDVPRLDTIDADAYRRLTSS